MTEQMEYTAEIQVGKNYSELLENHPTYKRNMEDTKRAKLEKIEDVENLVTYRITSSNEKFLWKIQSDIDFDIESGIFKYIEDQELAETLQLQEGRSMISDVEKKSNCEICTVNNKILIFALENRMKEITEQLGRLRPKLVKLEKIEFVQTESIKSIDLINDVSYATLKKYLTVGDELRKTSEVINFEELVSSLYNRIDPYKGKNTLITNTAKIDWTTGPGTFPFIFVCASSGTGKTQLPFSLDMPLLYLIFNQRLVEIGRAHV